MVIVGDRSYHHHLQLLCSHLLLPVRRTPQHPNGGRSASWTQGKGHILLETHTRTHKHCEAVRACSVLLEILICYYLFNDNFTALAGCYYTWVIFSHPLIREATSRWNVVVFFLCFFYISYNPSKYVYVCLWGFCVFFFLLPVLIVPPWGGGFVACRSGELFLHRAHRRRFFSLSVCFAESVFSFLSFHNVSPLSPSFLATEGNGISFTLELLLLLGVSLT